MEFLPTADDHEDTMAQLRSSYNRCINGIESIYMDTVTRKRCLVACRRLYELYMNDNENIIKHLNSRAHKAAIDQDLKQLSALSKELNLQNRNLARLMRLFSQDICDYHATDQTTVILDVPEGTNVDCDVFLEKLETLISEINNAKTGGAAVRVPKYQIE